MGRKVKVGIIGMGNMGCNYAKIILDGKVPELELTAVTRISQSKLEKAKVTLPDTVPVFHDAADLLAYGNLDAVLVVTPNYTHEEYIILALQKGLHVLCDKPAGVYTLQARRMIEEAGHHDLVFAMMFQQRTNPVFRIIKELVESERYGTVRRFNWTATDWYRTEAYYRSFSGNVTWKKDGGGVLLNQCAHNLDLLQWIFGMPLRIRAFCNEGKYHAIEVEDDATVYMEFPNGATGVFITSTGEGAGTNRLEIVFDNARLIYEDGQLRIFELKEDEKAYRRNSKECFGKIDGSWRNVTVSEENPQHLGILQNFADAILLQKPLIASGIEGLNSLILTNAMYLSSWKKETLELPLNDEEFFEELNKKYE